MGRLFLVEFDQTPEVNFYCCRTCQAHIALSQDCFSRMEQLREGMFSNVVNVVVDIRMEGFFQVEDIYCVRCNELLGWRYIRAEPNGTFLLKLAHLLFWDGARLLNADTLLDPVVDQENQEDHPQENQEDHPQENQENQEDQGNQENQEDQGNQGNQGEEDEDDQGPDDNVDID